MSGERAGFVNVDELMARVSLEQALTYYHVELPELRRIGDEIRTRCFLNCGWQSETGERALSIQPDHPAKIWRCHEAGCGRGGNLVSLCDLLRPGEHSGGKPRGDRFKAILRDLQAMAAGDSPPPAASETTTAPPRKVAPRGNRPLAESENERARGLVHLDEKFVVDPAEMTPKAASYFRHRGYLTPETARRWRMGYLPRDSGGDHAGGTMRGRIVYPLLSPQGELLTWFGRDPEFEERYDEWERGGKQGREPDKYHFVKGFQRGLELFGQHRIADESFRRQSAETGLLVVPGANDVIALEALGAAAVGLCGREVTTEQAEKVAALVRTCGAPGAVLMLDCTEAGDESARAVLPLLAAHTLVRLAWSREMHGGSFDGRTVDAVKDAEWERIAATLKNST